MLKGSLLVVAGSTLLSLVLTALARQLALRIGLVATPKVDRYHQRVVPMGGGLAIYGTLALPMLVLLVFTYCNSVFVANLSLRLGVELKDITVRRPELLTLLACITILFGLGLWDDKRGLGPMVKLGAQLSVGFVAAYFADMRVELFIEHRLLTSLLSAVWIALIINVFNFLDNMDGASAGIAAIVTGILFTAAVTSGQVLVGGLTLVFIGTLLGFLCFNFPPAKIFMGDAGSLVVGFMVAILSLRTTYYHEARSGDMYSLFVPLVALAVPLYDFISVTTLRLMQGKSPFVGDTQHFSHRLKHHGLTDTQTVLTLYLATLCTGLGATFLYQVNRTGAILIFVQTTLVLVMVAIFETKTKKNKDTP